MATSSPSASTEIIPGNSQWKRAADQIRSVDEEGSHLFRLPTKEGGIKPSIFTKTIAAQCRILQPLCEGGEEILHQLQGPRPELILSGARSLMFFKDAIDLTAFYNKITEDPFWSHKQISGPLLDLKDEDDEDWLQIDSDFINHFQIFTHERIDFAPYEKITKDLHISRNTNATWRIWQCCWAADQWEWDLQNPIHTEIFNSGNITILDLNDLMIQASKAPEGDYRAFNQVIRAIQAMSNASRTICSLLPRQKLAITDHLVTTTDGVAIIDPDTGKQKIRGSVECLDPSNDTGVTGIIPGDVPVLLEILDPVSYTTLTINDVKTQIKEGRAKPPVIHAVRSNGWIESPHRGTKSSNKFVIPADAIYPAALELEIQITERTNTVGAIFLAADDPLTARLTDLTSQDWRTIFYDQLHVGPLGIPVIAGIYIEKLDDCIMGSGEENLYNEIRVNNDQIPDDWCGLIWCASVGRLAGEDRLRKIQKKYGCELGSLLLNHYAVIKQVRLIMVIMQPPLKIRPHLFQAAAGSATRKLIPQQLACDNLPIVEAYGGSIVRQTVRAKIHEIPEPDRTCRSGLGKGSEAHLQQLPIYLSQPHSFVWGKIAAIEALSPDGIPRLLAYPITGSIPDIADWDHHLAALNPDPKWLGEIEKQEVAQQPTIPNVDRWDYWPFQSYADLGLNPSKITVPAQHKAKIQRTT